MGIGKEFFELYGKLGYSFTEITYLENALTHSSYTNEMRARGIRVKSNEELEFLGDAVLELVISEELYKRHKKAGEGLLTKMRQALVCEDTLAALALEFDLGAYLNIGTGEESSLLRSRAKVLADAFEAVIAAVYLDDLQATGGNNYKAVILNIFKGAIDRVEKGGTRDFKTMLQQFVEKNSGDVLRYNLEEEGPEHNKTFTATAYINNNLVGTGKGTTKRTAEMQAAEVALKLFGII